MTRAGVALLATLSLAGCAGLQATDTRSAERALTAAGFQTQPADTPEKLVQLRLLTQGKVLWRPQDGSATSTPIPPAANASTSAGTSSTCGSAAMRRWP